MMCVAPKQLMSDVHIYTDISIHDGWPSAMMNPTRFASPHGRALRPRAKQWHQCRSRRQRYEAREPAVIPALHFDPTKPKQTCARPTQQFLFYPDRFLLVKSAWDTDPIQVSFVADVDVCSCDPNSQPWSYLHWCWWETMGGFLISTAGVPQTAHVMLRSWIQAEQYPPQWGGNFTVADKRCRFLEGKAIAIS